MRTSGAQPTELALMTARARLTGLNRELKRSPGKVVRITHRGKPAMTLMSSELYETLEETLDLMASPDAVEALRRSLADIEAGRVYTLAEVAARLGLKR